jgi:hypothetical protein
VTANDLKTAIEAPGEADVTANDLKTAILRDIAGLSRLIPKLSNIGRKWIRQ